MQYNITDCGMIALQPAHPLLKFITHSLLIIGNYSYPPLPSSVSNLDVFTSVISSP